MKLSEKYINGLKKAYSDNHSEKEWEHFESVKHGALKEDIQKIREEYPDVPDSLTELLEYADGTYHREYEGEKITVYFFGSDIDDWGYPYYLFSCAQIIENKNSADDFSDYIERLYEDSVAVTDGRITDRADTAKWLNFSDCMNNGGTSSLFIDFTPSESGKAGQIIRFLHDPDEFTVIADSFDDYLQLLMDKGYGFIGEITV